MIDRHAFFTSVSKPLFAGVFTQRQVDGINSLLDAWETQQALIDPRHLAYCLATALHETAATMQPIEEYGKGANYAYGKRVKQSGQSYTDFPSVYYGRGYVQLTWYENYQRAGRELGVDFLAAPALVMRPDHAANIMYKGMAQGWFTGRKLADYINASVCDWVNARRIINGTDKAQLIAGYAQQFNAAIMGALQTPGEFDDVTAGSSSTARKV